MIDIARQPLVATVPVRRILDGIAISPHGRCAHVANYGADTVSVVGLGTA
ncbi:hypothetical protein [Streptantibioticus ferralitis]|uniref:Uncharacterized protein n=1 Tax=Streptantibioticus ferralitis TaxID=236510 RepID=A0ABT5ZAL0_9ACTN|nr:hypothetical protein [Streptantibioticus ferralitis]MDF2260100.1 hypothetical protein [Streptantibioticus ferralitis]